ncbi:MAG: DUF4139 domain-containing protein [Candidatus Hydrogenedentales bacterium]
MKIQFLAFVLAASVFTTALAQEPAEPAPEHATTLEDQTDIALTAYNNGLGLVRDTREVTLPTGELRIQFRDVAELIRPETVSLRSLTNPGSLTILEQNYEYDLISPEKLMEKYVGQTVRLVNFSTELGFQEVTAELLSVNNGPIYEVNGEIYLGHPGTVVLPEIPENLIAKPSLIWEVDNAAGDQTIEATYLTNGISWKADYVVTLAKDEKALDLAGWVTMNNNSGATYENALLKLVAGDVNIVAEEMDVAKFQRMEMAAQAMPAPMAVQEAFAEYHLYTIPRRTTIKQNQSKQLALLQAAGVSVEKRYEFRGQLHYYSQPIQPEGEQHVEAFLVFQNEEENQMGMPLPAGIMRVYQEDSEGALQFSGEDRIQHTPKDEEVRLRLGTAFDVVGERTQTDFTRISDRVFETAFEIELRNHKETDITIDVVEPMPADWEILQQSHEHEQRDAFTAVFSIAVPADGEATLTYRVRVRY